MRSGRGGIAAALAVVALGCAVGTASAASARGKAAHPLVLHAATEAVDAETVVFADPRRPPVQVLRGRRKAALPAAPRQHTEIVSFGADRVAVIHSGPPSPASPKKTAPQTRSQTVSFTDPRLGSVTIVRGAGPPSWFAIDLFGPANGGELERIAFAVDGVESRHGGDPRMWRPEPEGPQGPMQVSAAAAYDVGGGDRFDLRQNRVLGRAYLAQMFRRYGNWPDALAAYNWGPGNLDLWIALGRNPGQLPLDVARYVARVLHDALISAAGL
jgi:transglycosylase-like protein with SLT domain